MDFEDFPQIGCRLVFLKSRQLYERSQLTIVETDARAHLEGVSQRSALAPRVLSHEARCARFSSGFVVFALSPCLDMFYIYPI